MLEVLKELDAEISKEYRFIANYINAKQNTYKSDLFDDVVVVKSLDDIEGTCYKRLRGRHGLYVFLIDEAFDLTHEQVLSFNQLKGANINDISILFVVDTACLYVGSCISNSLYSRLKVHFQPDRLNKYGLHLGHPKRSMFLGRVTVYAFTIKKEYEEYMKLFVPGLEKMLHDELCPVAGSSRT